MIMNKPRVVDVDLDTVVVAIVVAVSVVVMVIDISIITRSRIPFITRSRNVMKRMKKKRVNKATRMRKTYVITVVVKVIGHIPIVLPDILLNFTKNHLKIKRKRLKHILLTKMMTLIMVK